MNILEAARRQRVATDRSPAVVIVTSGEVYGKLASHQLPATEELPLIPNTPYSASKASLDMISQQYAACFGVDVVIVRPFNHAGPRQSPSFVVSDFAKQFAEIALGRREPMLHVGNTSITRDFTDVRDVVRAYWNLFERKTGDSIFNVASGRGMKIHDIRLTLQEISGINVSVRQQHERMRAYDVPVITASYDRLHKATGWTPSITFRQTVEDTYNYWLDALRGGVLSKS
jgi:GDP-4-dehydro-6-deoxy-D-mannose reductase